MPPDWRTLAESQAAPLDLAVGRAIRDMRGLHEAYRRDVVALLTDASGQVETVGPDALPWLLPRLRLLVDDYARRSTASLGSNLAAVRALVVEQVIEVLAAFEPPSTVAAIRAGLDAGGDMSTAALWIARFWRDQGSAVEGAMLTAATGGLRWTAAIRLAAAPTESATSRLRGRAGVVADMEARRAAALKAEQAIRWSADILARDEGDAYLTTPLQRRIVEIIDKRNHPISRVLDGQVRPIGKPFSATVEEVFIQSRLLGKSAGGIVWQRRGLAYSGSTLPAHYADRGRIVPYRQSWES